MIIKEHKIKSINQESRGTTATYFSRDEKCFARRFSPWAPPDPAGQYLDDSAHHFYHDVDVLEPGRRVRHLGRTH